jgi:hypothetical protein
LISGNAARVGLVLIGAPRVVQNFLNVIASMNAAKK